MEEQSKQYLTVEEVAQGLSVSEETVRRMIADGQLQAIRVRTLLRIPAMALADLEATEGPQSEGGR